MKDLVASLRPALVLVIGFTVVTGLLYPLAVTAAAQAVFPHQASGSMIEDDGVVVGSELIGQPFADPGHFWSRPSATGYTAQTSSGTNHGPSNPALRDAVAARIEALRAADPDNRLPIPVDLVTASGSGLDPDITPAAARYQVPRIARIRGLSVPEVTALVERHVEERTFGVLGERHVNVLRLNRALDALAKGGTPTP